MRNPVLPCVDADLACPACRGELLESDGGLTCIGCARAFPGVAGLIDLRLESDRYLGLEAERAKARRLAQVETETDLRGLAAAYYEQTDDVLDARRGRFLRHIAQAEVRGGALLGRLPEEGRILEVGCGTGGLLVPALRAGRSIIGVDIAARWLVVARRRLADHGLEGRLVVARAEQLPWDDGRFDVVVADSVLEHLDDPASALAEWARVLRPGGRLVVWSPNRYTLTTDPHVGLWGIGWLPRSWVPGYLRRRGRAAWPPRTRSAAEAMGLARGAGLERVEVGVPPIPREWARSLSHGPRLAATGYGWARAWGPTQVALRMLGPLWELRGSRKEGA